MYVGVVYVAVVLFDVAPKSCAVTPTSGCHCARGTFVASFEAATRAMPASTAGWCARA